MSRYNITMSDPNQFVWYRIAKNATQTMRKTFKADKHVKLTKPFGQGMEYNEKWDSYFKFTIVRNPWDRLVSCWSQKVNWHSAPWRNLRKWKEFDDFVRIVCNKMRPNSIKCDRHVRVQTTMYNQEKIDYIGRFEDLQGSFDYICNQIGIDTVELRKVNKSKHTKYMEYYTDETRELVQQTYINDIKQLGYEFGK